MTPPQPVPPKSVFITGTSSGIGAACALDLVARGFRVFAGVRQPADGERLRQSAGERLVPVLVDVTDEDTIRAAAAEIDAAVGPAGLAGLVNNAGIVVPGPLELLPTSAFRRQLEVNVLGTHAVTRALLPLIRRAQGRIVIIGSISGLVAPPFIGAYAASKHALEGLAAALRAELVPWRIRVSIIEPDSIATPIWEKLDQTMSEIDYDGSPEVRQAYDEAFRQVRIGSMRMGRSGSPTSTVVRAVAHALSARWPKAHYPLGWRPLLAFGGARHVPPALLDWILRRSMGLR